jgi:hypothetical protein
MSGSLPKPLAATDPRPGPAHTIPVYGEDLPGSSRDEQLRMCIEHLADFTAAQAIWAVSEGDHIVVIRASMLGCFHVLS